MYDTDITKVIGEFQMPHMWKLITSLEEHNRFMVPINEVLGKMILFGSPLYICNIPNVIEILEVQISFRCFLSKINYLL